MSQNETAINIMPYSMIVGQENLKLALELVYIAPRIGGVLLSGQRGTGKSTAVRAFARMMDENGRLPVTIPINATEDRVIGGWDINALMLEGKPIPQPGLLEEANGQILYIDEVNLLDDHIVNIILDVTATGVLVIQRDGLRGEENIAFTLVGTMNPEEGGLRPQLLDRFGLMVHITAETNTDVRSRILSTVMDYDKERFLHSQGEPTPLIDAALKNDQEYKKSLEAAREQLYKVDISQDMTDLCVQIAQDIQAEGHRGDYVMALAARAYAARTGDSEVNAEHIKSVAPLALQHRQPEASHNNQILWGEEQEAIVANYLNNA